MVIDEQGKEGENGVPSSMLKARGVPAEAIFGRLRKYVMHAVGSFFFSVLLGIKGPSTTPGHTNFLGGGNTLCIHRRSPVFRFGIALFFVFSSLRFFFLCSLSFLCSATAVVCVQSSSLYINLYCVVFFRFFACLLTALKSYWVLFLVCVGPPSKLGLRRDVLGRLAE